MNHVFSSVQLACSSVTIRLYVRGDIGDATECADIIANGNYIGSTCFPNALDCDKVYNEVDFIVSNSIFNSW